MSDLYNAFCEHFEIIIADTPKLLEEVYRIRYRVLCVEKRIPGFEKAFYADGQEKDDYDSHSSHALIRYRFSKEFIGTVRLILFDSTNPEKLFPVETNGQIDRRLLDLSKWDRQHTAEISRFVVITRFNRRQGERRNLESRKNHAGSTDRRSRLDMALVLMAGVLRMCDHFDVRNWLSFMDPALNRLLSVSGLSFNPIGPIVDHHGFRKPYFLKIADTLSVMEESYHDAWEVMTDNGKYSRFLADKAEPLTTKVGSFSVSG